MDQPVLRFHADPGEIDAAQWNALLAAQAAPSPFMRHEYLDALHRSGSATPEHGWTPQFATLWRGQTMLAACPLYIKDHSYGEYLHLCTLLSIDQMKLSLQDGCNKGTSDRGAAHQISVCSRPSRTLSRAPKARITSR